METPSIKKFISKPAEWKHQPVCPSCHIFLSRQELSQGQIVCRGCGQCVIGRSF